MAKNVTTNIPLKRAFCVTKHLQPNHPRPVNPHGTRIAGVPGLAELLTASKDTVGGTLRESLEATEETVVFAASGTRPCRNQGDYKPYGSTAKTWG
eukprot:5319510-Amphidinium_carterae.2